jgi:hypothetical protein
MSSDNTSHRERPGPDVIPSRYALRVVEIAEWNNAFEHDPEEATRVRVRLLRELAETREPLVATHLPFPSVCHVVVAGHVFRCVPAVWEY